MLRLSTMNPRALLYSEHNRSASIALLIIRVTVGLFMAAHGFAKLSGGVGEFAGALAGMGFPLPGFFAWCAVLAEFVGGLLMTLGLLARPAALAVGFTMVVAWVAVHLGDLPKIGGQGGSAFEYPFLLSISALGIAIAGPGRYSLDALLLGRSPARAGSVAS